MILNLARDRYALVVKSGSRKLNQRMVDLEGEPCEAEVETTVGGTAIEGFVSRRGQPLARKSFALSPLGRKDEAATATLIQSVGDDGQAVVREILGKGWDTVQASTDDAGFYSVERLEPGGYQAALVEGTRTLARTISVPDASLARIDIDLTGASLHGSVSDGKTGDPLAGADVQLSLDGDGRLLDSVETDDSGSFEFPDLMESRYRLAVSREGYRSAAATLEHRVGSVAPVRISLEKSGIKVLGRIRNSTGFHVSGATVLWTLETAVRPRGGTATSDPEGLYEIPGLETGRLGSL